jgi:outer membrane protein OmpA-like peptidoglycan-associated protein
MSREQRGDPFAQPMTDLMAGVAVTFLLIAAIFMVQSARKTEAEKRAKEQAKAQLSKHEGAEDLAKSSLKQLQQDLASESLVDAQYDPHVDPFLLTIVFNRSRLRFAKADCAISDETRRDLESAKPIFKKVCDKQNESAGLGITQSITLEGHTDRDPDFESAPACGVQVADWRSECADPVERVSPRCIRQGFENNVRLSAARAQNVFFTVRRAFKDDEEILGCLDKSFVVAGRGPVEPEAGGDWQTFRVDRSADERDRRVVIKVRVQVRGFDAGAP